MYCIGGFVSTDFGSLCPLAFLKDQLNLLSICYMYLLLLIINEVLLNTSLVKISISGFRVLYIDVTVIVLISHVIVYIMFWRNSFLVCLSL